MENTSKQNVEERERKPFTDVDVWRSSFGPISVKAVFEVYNAKFNVKGDSPHKRKSFRHCLNALRKLEKPDYKPSDLFLPLK